MTLNKAYTDEYLAHVDALQGDAAGKRAAREHMEHSTAIYHGTVVNSSVMAFSRKSTMAMCGCSTLNA